MSRSLSRTLDALFVAFVAVSVLGCSATTPTVVIQAPAAGSGFKADENVTIQSVATDPGGIASVDLLVDGVTAWNKRPPSKEGNSLFAASFPWKATEGMHTLGVKAYNAAGAVSPMVFVTVTVSAAATSSARPVKSLPVFVRDGHMCIFMMNEDGSGLVQLTNGPGDDNRPSMSPDRDGNWEIYVMNADGKQQTRLTQNTADDTQAAWSPDGKRIAFLSNRDGQLELYAMNADGTDQTRLTTAGAALEAPGWSPDGKRIAFVSNRAGNAEIYVMNADGSQQVRVTNTPKIESSPAWSPDGRRIAFESRRDGQSDVYIMHADGSEQTRLTNLPGVKGGIHFSPAGDVWFGSLQDGKLTNYTMKADGSGLVALHTYATDVPPGTPTPAAK